METNRFHKSDHRMECNENNTKETRSFRQTCRELASAWFRSRNSALSESHWAMACRRSVRPSLSVSLTLAPPPSSSSPISNRLPAHSATPSADCPEESFNDRFGMTWRLRPLCVTWASAHHSKNHNMSVQQRKHPRFSWVISTPTELFYQSHPNGILNSFCSYNLYGFHSVFMSFLSPFCNIFYIFKRLHQCSVEGTIQILLTWLTDWTIIKQMSTLSTVLLCRSYHVTSVDIPLKSRNTLTISLCPVSTATWSGVCFITPLLSPVGDVVWMLALAPASSNERTRETRPWRHAMWSGVSP